MERFNSSKHSELAHKLPFSYFSTYVYLDFSARILIRNDEQIIVDQDMYYPHEFPALFLPRNPLNWQHCSITFTTEEEKNTIKEKVKILIDKPSGDEYFYKTQSLINPTSDIERRIEQFKKYEYTVLDTYPKDKIIQFYDFWKSQRDRSADTFESSENFFYFCLENLDAYNVKQIYVEINGELVGFAWGVKHHKEGWVGLHLKVNYDIKGLSRFLHNERAKMFSVVEKFTLGTGAHEQGISQFKEELGPEYVKKYSYILTR